MPGAIGVVSATTKGTIPEEIPLITQEENINEINFNPFDDHLIAAASADGAARYYLPSPFPNLLHTCFIPPIITLPLSNRHQHNIQHHQHNKHSLICINCSIKIVCHSRGRTYQGHHHTHCYPEWSQQASHVR